jgi:hypothetical protein
MRTALNGDSTSPESLLLGRIQQELMDLSERQHVMARRINTLRQARTQLHLGRSAGAVSAILAEHTQKEAAGQAPWLELAGDHGDPALAGGSAWDLRPQFDRYDRSYPRVSGV